MANEQAAGRFRPGQSGNPGGRPSADQVVRRLSSRRGWNALRVLCAALDEGAEMIVIDARGVFADRERAQAFDDDHDLPTRPEMDGDALLRRGRMQRRAEYETQFAAQWVAADRQGLGSDGAPFTQFGRRHIISGEWLGLWPWHDRCDSWVQNPMGLDAIGARESGGGSVG